MNKFRIKETYLLLMIVFGLVSLSVYTTYAMFTASTTLNNVVNFVTTLDLNTNLSEYELITLTGNETQVIEVNVTNSYDSTLCYGIWYEVVSGDSSSLDIGTFTEKNTTLPSGQITSGSTITAVVGMSNGSTSSITLKLGTIGRETSGSSCSLGITSPRSLIGTEWADVILVTDEYLSEHTTTASEDYSWSSNTSGSTTLTLEPGEYLLQVWGAQGGSYNSTYATGGKGGYSYGTLTLSEETTVYAYVGGQGSYGTSTTYTATSGGGFNGGGNAGYRGGGGGGASDIRIGTDSLYARVIVAGGGGGAYAYNSSYKANGGEGGGSYGGDATSYSSDTYRGGGGTQTAGGASGTALTSGNYNGSAGSFGTGGDTGYKYNSSSYYSNGAGGGGWYGGGAADNYNGSSRNYASGGGGGSGYVYTSSTALDYPSGCLLTSPHYLTNAATLAGFKSFTDYDGTTVTGHSGNGAIKITGTTSATYSIPTLTGLTTLKIKVGSSANYTAGVKVVCASGTTGCSIVTYPTLDTSTLEEGTYTVYYVVKGADNKKYKFERTIKVMKEALSEVGDLLSTAEVGSYVSYLGTNGCSGELCAGKNHNQTSTSLGYCIEGATGTVDSYYKYYGWRIAYVENNNVHLVSAGGPSCYGSSTTEEGIASVISDLNDIALQYCNVTYVNGNACSVDNTWALNAYDFEKITDISLSSCYNNSSTYCGKDNPLLDVGVDYWFATRYSGTSSWKLLWTNWNHVIEYADLVSSAGVRPVIKLSSKVYVTGGSGTITDPYTIGI